MQTIKLYILLIIALVVCTNLFSQINVYKPFPQVYGSWYVSGQHYSGSPPTTSSFSYKNYQAIGDTTVGLYTYKKVTVSTSMNNPFNFGPRLFAFGYRNDSLNKKVYYLDVTSGINKDTLWYDFNLNVGDSLKETYAYSAFGYIMNNQRRIVNSIDSVLICGAYHRQFNFGCLVTGGFETSLIEGVGFKDRFDITGYLGGCPFEPSAVYSTYFSTCNIASVEDYSKDNQIQLYPNPAITELNINSSLQATEYAILNNIGAILLKGNLLESQSVDLSFLATGIYVIKIQDKSGNTKQSKFIKQ
ncbi:MAG: T9SS type A sorting domain-containing protein [Bacteroidota bacterium]